MPTGPEWTAKSANAGSLAKALPGPLKKWAIRAGRVHDIVANACVPDPEIWVLAAFYALPTLLLTPVLPSATDYLIVRFGQRHGKKPKFKFDVWDFHQLPAPESSEVAWFVFKGIGLGARALWYIAIADAVTAFAVRWTSLAYQFAGCRFSQAGYCQLTLDAQYANDPPFSFGTANWWQVSAQDIFHGSTESIGTPAGYTPSAMWAVTTIPDERFPPNQRGTIRSTLHDAVGGISHQGTHLFNPTTGNGYTSGMHYGQNDASLGHNYTIQYFETGACLLESAVFTAVGADPRDAITPFSGRGFQ